MGNVVHCIHAKNIWNLFDTPRGQGNYKNKAESRKMGLRLFPMKYQKPSFFFVLKIKGSNCSVDGYSNSRNKNNGTEIFQIPIKDDEYRRNGGRQPVKGTDSKEVFVDLWLTYR